MNYTIWAIFILILTLKKAVYRFFLSRASILTHDTDTAFLYVCPKVAGPKAPKFLGPLHPFWINQIQHGNKWVMDVFLAVSHAPSKRGRPQCSQTFAGPRRMAGDQIRNSNTTRVGACLHRSAMHQIQVAEPQSTQFICLNIHTIWYSTAKFGVISHLKERCVSWGPPTLPN